MVSKDWATVFQPPIPVFDLPVKGCDLLLRFRSFIQLAPIGLILLKDTRHPKNLILAREFYYS
jgi:hypothetical protein